MNPLDQLIYEGKAPHKKLTPFKDWKGSKLQNVEVTMRLLTAGENDDIAMIISPLPIASQISHGILQQLARAIVTISGQLIASDEMVRKYNEGADLEGPRQINGVGLVLMKLKNMDQAIIDQLNVEYVKLQKIHDDDLKGIKKKSTTPKVEPSGELEEQLDLKK